METAIIIFLYICALLSDFRLILKKKSKKINTVYVIMIITSFTLLILDSLHVKIPSPSLIIKKIIESFI